MFHLHFVGYFDPCDAFTKALGPKPLRPVSREAVERTLARFDPSVTQFVSYRPEGWVVCDWTRPKGLRLSNAVREFAVTLAENCGGMVMTELFQIVFPAWARQAQEEHFGRLNAQREQALTPPRT